MPHNEPESTLAYSSAATWITTLDHLHTAGIPNLVDRNALPPTFSGSSKYEMLGTLRFFALIDKNGKPDKDRLGKLTSPSTRKDALLSLLHDYYPTLFALPLETAGPTEVQRWFSDNATPSTVGKAKAFFLALAKQTDVALHSMVAKGTRAATGSVRRKRKKRVGGASSAVVGEQSTSNDVESENRYSPIIENGESRSVSLRSGAGTVSLSVSVSLWDLEGDDLTFVLALMRALRGYEKGEVPSIVAMSKSTEADA